jgi:ketopantoate reductase
MGKVTNGMGEEPILVVAQMTSGEIAKNPASSKLIHLVIHQFLAIIGRIQRSLFKE